MQLLGQLFYWGKKMSENKGLNGYIVGDRTTLLLTHGDGHL